MKRCPVCGKMYGYESLRFCRFDGSRLVDATACEAPTILLSPHEMQQKTGGLHIDSVTGEHRIPRYS